MKSLASADVLADTRRRLLSLTVDDQARWGMMTVSQMMRHVGCSYEVALGERAVGPLKGPPPALLKWVALRSGMRWPKNIETTPELKRVTAEESWVEFNSARAESIEKMEALATGTRCASRHPMFGSMSIEDWRRWGYLHADHHLRQFGR